MTISADEHEELVSLSLMEAIEMNQEDLQRMVDLTLKKYSDRLAEQKFADSIVEDLVECGVIKTELLEKIRTILEERSKALSSTTSDLANHPQGLSDLLQAEQQHESQIERFISDAADQRAEEADTEEQRLEHVQELASSSISMHRTPSHGKNDKNLEIHERLNVQEKLVEAQDSTSGKSRAAISFVVIAIQVVFQMN